MEKKKLSTEEVIKKYRLILAERKRIECPPHRTEKWDKEAFHFKVRIVRIPEGGCAMCEHIFEHGENWAQVYPQPSAHSRAHEKERAYEVVYSKGAGHVDKRGNPIRPTLEEVLEDAIQNACPFEQGPTTFEDWAQEYGYDLDSRKAEKTFLACQRYAAKFRDMIGFSGFVDVTENWEEA